MPLSTAEGFKDALALFDLAKKVAARRTELVTAAGAAPDETDIDLQLVQEFAPELVAFVRTIRADFKS